MMIFTEENENENDSHRKKQPITGTSNHYQQQQRQFINDESVSQSQVQLVKFKGKFFES